MLPRRVTKKFHSRVTNEEKINFTDERIKQLIREYTDTDNLNKRKRLQNELKDTMNFRSKFTHVPFENLIAHAIINGTQINRVGINSEGKFYSEVVLPDNILS